MMLGLLEKVTLSPAQVSASDVQPLLAAGISEQAIEDALIICAGFNIISRIADALDVAIPSAEGFACTGEALLDHGYV
jgi:alkylhydroperoxidase family enzyme